MKVEVDRMAFDFAFGAHIYKGRLVIDIPGRQINVMTNRYWESIQPPEDICTRCGRFVWKHDDHDHKFVVPSTGMSDEQREFMADAEELYNRNPF